MSRILIIEDNATIADALRRNLEAEGYEVLLAADGESGLQRVTTDHPDLVVLDLRLPKLGGHDVLRRMRSAQYDQPVLILSALSAEVDKVRGFRAGADDYVTKPFGVGEVLARIAALLRRAAPRPVAAPRVWAFGTVEVQGDARRVTRGGTEVPLRPMELDLLLAMLRNPGTVLSRQALLTEVWRYHPGVSSRTVDVHICELRRKLEDDPEHPRFFETVWKAGYRFNRG